jgi:protein-L-isoaspartate(D-aspartate) O-methyltransferase
MIRVNDRDDSPIGWEEESPFDAIIVTAGAPDIPKILTDQLAIGGRLVIPVGSEVEQRLVKIVKAADGELEMVDSISCRFVPLIGKQGW